MFSAGTTDIFALGVILYEMASGHHPFAELSAVETMSAIASKDPSGLSTLRAAVAPVLARIVTRCLEKDPEARFQSARDIAFILESVDAERPPNLEESPVSRWHTAKRALLHALAVATAIAAGAFVALRLDRHADPAFRRLTFQRGTVHSARFAPDGRTIVYSAAWNGGPSRVFVTRSDTQESTALDLPAGNLLATTSTGELIVLLDNVTNSLPPATGHQGTLARASLTGGAARELLERVEDADVAPDGSAFAIVRSVGERQRLEYPVGTSLYETAGYISHPRLSPRRDRIAFLDHPVRDDDRGVVAIVDLRGTKTVLTREWIGEQGLAWSPDGREIWFAAGPGDGPRAIYAATLSGDVRLVYRAPVHLTLGDVDREGRVLLWSEQLRTDVMGISAGETRQRDLSWFYLQNARGLSADGRTFVFAWLSGFDYATYMRKTDGSPAIRLGEGNPHDLSADGKWVVAASFSAPDRLTLLPTGAGEAKTISLGRVKFDASVIAHWTPDGRGVVFAGSEPGRGVRTYVAEIGGGPRPITTEGLVGTLLSPDGARLLARDADGRRVFIDLTNSRVGQVPGLQAGDSIAGWDATGTALYIYRESDSPMRIYKVNAATGRRESTLAIGPADAGGVIRSVLVTPDGRSAVYNVHRRSADLFMVTGLR